MRLLFLFLLIVYVFCSGSENTDPVVLKMYEETKLALESDQKLLREMESLLNEGYPGPRPPQMLENQAKASERLKLQRALLAQRARLARPKTASSDEAGEMYKLEAEMKAVRKNAVYNAQHRRYDYSH